VIGDALAGFRIGKKEATDVLDSVVGNPDGNSAWAPIHFHRRQVMLNYAEI